MNDPKKSVLITGCSSGIGLSVAVGLKARGYRVFATARKTEDVSTLLEMGFEALPLDLDDSNSISDAVNSVMQSTGDDLYALFNNGAYGQPGALEDLSRDVLRAQFETNLFGWHELTRMVLPYMRRRGQGRIIQNSSILGFIALNYRGAYIASKYALEGLSDTLRLELNGSGIHVSLIQPGPIESRFRENALQMWQQNVDPEGSAHAKQYAGMLTRLNKKGSTSRFTLPADAVLPKVIHALESPKPKARYAVTTATEIMGPLKRLLPTHWLDRLLLRISE